MAGCWFKESDGVQVGACSAHEIRRTLAETSNLLFIPVDP